MNRYRGNIVTRLMAGIAFGLLFLAGGFFLVGKYLTPDLMICQRLHFTIPESQQDQFHTHWAAFAKEQQVQLIDLAENKLSWLASYLSVIPRSDKPVITLRLRCPPDADDDIHQNFNNLVDAYITQRTVIERSEIATGSKTVFQAQLDMSQNDIAKTKPFSRFQQFVLVMFAVAGFLLGVGPPGGYVHLNEEESTEVPREIQRMIRPATGDLPVPYSTAFDTMTATEVVVAVPPKKVLLQSEQAVFPVVEKITVDEAGIATENNEPQTETSELQEEVESSQDIEPKPIPIPESEIVVEEKSPVITDREEPVAEKNETIPLAPIREEKQRKEEEKIAEPEEEFVEEEQAAEEDIPAEPAAPKTVLETEEEEEPAETLEEEIENHALEQEVLLSEIVIPKKKTEPEDSRKMAAEAAKEETKPVLEPEPEPEPEPVVEESQSIPKVEDVTPPKLQPESALVPGVSESEESKVAEEQETLPVVAIDLNKDMPSAGGPNAARSKYDTLADLVEKLRPQVRCPVIGISALKSKDVSPRLTVNLAVTLIRRALRVLIVEADPASKELATLFGLPEDPGFFEWRRGAAWISHTTHRTQLVGLSVMPAGIPNEQQKNPDLELWREKHRWGNLAKDFDVVLLYYPAALAEEPQTPEQTMGVHMRDMCQGILALTRSTKQIEKTAQTAVDTLANHTAPLLAIIPIKA
jgi:Mrp family chromosome partitioning ATPase